MDETKVRGEDEELRNQSVVQLRVPLLVLVPAFNCSYSGLNQRSFSLGATAAQP